MSALPTCLTRSTVMPRNESGEIVCPAAGWLGRWDLRLPSPSSASPGHPLPLNRIALAPQPAPSSGAAHKRRAVYDSSALACAADARGLLPAAGHRESTAPTPPTRMAVGYSARGGPARSAPASAQRPRPTLFFSQSHSTFSCPICWESAALSAASAVGLVPRRLDHTWGSPA